MEEQNIEEAFVSLSLNNEIEYDNYTSPRGLVYILNYVFEDYPDIKREGTDIDVARLRAVFESMDYLVEEHRDLSLVETQSRINRLRQQERLEKLSSLIVVILSHGINSTTFMTSDKGLMSLELIHHYLNGENCPHLEDKPKVFLCGFTQCKITNLNKIEQLKRKVLTKPVQNTLCIYSSQDGFQSYVSRECGMKYIEKFCNAVILKRQLNITQLLNEIARMYAMESPQEVPEYHNLGFVKSFYFFPQKEIIKGITKIRDDNLTEMAKVLRIKKPESVEVNITAKSFHHRDFFIVLDIIARYRSDVKELSFQHLFRNPDPTLHKASLDAAITKVLTRCKVDRYIGYLTHHIELPRTQILPSLSVCVSEINGFWKLQDALNRRIEVLAFCFNSNLPLHNVTKVFDNIPYLDIYCPDIQSVEEFHKASNIIKALQPRQQDINHVIFPRLRLNAIELSQGIKNFQGMRVRWIVFSSSLPFSAQEKDKLQSLIQRQIKKCCVYWGCNGYVDINDW